MIKNKRANYSGYDNYYLNIKKIQKELTDRECVEVSFMGSWDFVITYNNIYIIKDSPTFEDLEILHFFNVWDYKTQRDYYIEYGLIEIEELNDEKIDKILKKMIKQCKYSVDDYFYKTEKELQKNG